jgi:hypothetical protein
MPNKNRMDWTVEKMQAAIDHCPHQLALQPKALQLFNKEIWNIVSKDRHVWFHGTRSNMTLHIS